MWLKKTMIVPSAQVSTCRALAVALAQEAGANMWLTELSPSGNSPATHFISSGMIQDNFYAYMTDPSLLSQVSGMSLAAATSVLSDCDISDDEPFVALERLGLMKVVGEL